jgi:hypothetical protein
MRNVSTRFQNHSLGTACTETDDPLRLFHRTKLVLIAVEGENRTSHCSKILVDGLVILELRSKIVLRRKEPVGNGIRRSHVEVL